MLFSQCLFLWTSVIPVQYACITQAEGEINAKYYILYAFLLKRICYRFSVHSFSCLMTSWGCVIDTYTFLPHLSHNRQLLSVSYVAGTEYTVCFNFIMFIMTYKLYKKDGKYFFIKYVSPASGTEIYRRHYHDRRSFVPQPPRANSCSSSVCLLRQSGIALRST
jgi:hypothetical protein